MVLIITGTLVTGVFPSTLLYQVLAGGIIVGGSRSDTPVSVRSGDMAAAVPSLLAFDGRPAPAIRSAVSRNRPNRSRPSYRYRLSVVVQAMGLFALMSRGRFRPPVVLPVENSF